MLLRHYLLCFLRQSRSLVRSLLRRLDNPTDSLVSVFPLLGLQEGAVYSSFHLFVFNVVSGAELSPLCLYSKHSLTEQYPQSLLFFGGGVLSFESFAAFTKNTQIPKHIMKCEVLAHKPLARPSLMRVSMVWMLRRVQRNIILKSTGFQWFPNKWKSDWYFR